MSIKSHIRKTLHKYDIELPKSHSQDIYIDKKNKNKVCQDSIDKEIHNINVAFEVMGKGEKAPPAWNEVAGHLVYNLKMNFNVRGTLGFGRTQDSRTYWLYLCWGSLKGKC